MGMQRWAETTPFPRVRLRWGLLAFSFFLLAACKPGRPSGILSESKMEKVLVDYHLAQGMAEASEGNKDVIRYKYIQAVFRKHKITEATFDSSMIYYSRNAEKLALIYKNVTRRVEAQATKMGVDAQATHDQYANLTNQGDTANIWTDRPHHTLQVNPLDNLYSFRMTADSSFKAGDRFLWRFQTEYWGQTLTREALAMLMVEYMNDSVACINQRLSDNKLMEISYEPKPSLDTVELRSVGGFVYLPIKQEEKKDFQVLILSKMSLIRFHHKLDSLLTDSLLTDTLETDTMDADLPKASKRRLTPQEMRESQPRERKVNVVKEKPVYPRRQQNRRNNRRGW